ncbi:MAG: iron-sulfur cluster assembly accessory protein [Clostridia bacterium]|nr:iron-sulfur cluster assembly accessory protein [Clostridia bacterium]
MAIQFTPEAVKELKELIKQEGEPKPDLRIHIQHRCGCGNVHFGMGWDDKRPEDEVVEQDGFRVIFDKETATYLEDAEVDFEERGVQRGFVIRRPNAGHCCGH